MLLSHTSSKTVRKLMSVEFSAVLLVLSCVPGQRTLDILVENMTYRTYNIQHTHTDI